MAITTLATLRRKLSLALCIGLAIPGIAMAQAWMQLSPAGVPPEARLVTVSASVYDAASNRMIVFGGLSNVYANGPAALRNDVWVLEHADGLGGVPAWTQLLANDTPGSPSRRREHSTVYDPATNRLIMFGGNPNSGYCFGDTNDLWVLENANGTGGAPVWTQLIPPGMPGSPSARAGHAAAYDPLTNRMIVFGGSNECVDPDPATHEVWVLEHANGVGGTPTWSKLQPTGGSPSARPHGAVYDPANDRMIVMFPSGPYWGGTVNEVWVLENASAAGGPPNWIQLAPTGDAPGWRYGHSAVYDAAANKMTVFGGQGPGSTNPGYRFDDVWVLENANGLGGTPSWVRLFPGPDPETGAAPIAREFAAAIYNPVNRRMTVFGGFACLTPGPCTSPSEYSSLNDTWVLTEATGTTPEELAETKIVSAGDVMATLAPAAFTTEGNRQTLLNFLSQAIVAIQIGDIPAAIDKLDKSISRTDGCALRGAADGNGPGRDWITDCSAQIEVYDLLTAARSALS